MSAVGALAVSAVGALAGSAVGALPVSAVVVAGACCPESALAVESLEGAEGEVVVEGAAGTLALGLVDDSEPLLVALLTRCGFIVVEFFADCFEPLVAG